MANPIDLARLTSALEVLNLPVAVEYDHRVTPAGKKLIRARIINDDGFCLASLVEMEVAPGEPYTDPDAEALALVLNAAPSMVERLAEVVTMDLAVNAALDRAEAALDRAEAQAPRFVVVPVSEVNGRPASYWYLLEMAEECARSCERSGWLRGKDGPFQVARWAVVDTRPVAPS